MQAMNFKKVEVKGFTKQEAIAEAPFGKNTLSKSFVKNSYKFSDYVVFILPISQYKNNYETYEFDLIFSEDLGSVNYGGRDVKCCFNIYKRPCNKLNKKPNYKLKNVVLYEYRRNEREVPSIDYDYRMCSYGDIGKVCDYDGQYVKEICVKT